MSYESATMVAKKSIVFIVFRTFSLSLPSFSSPPPPPKALNSDHMQWMVELLVLKGPSHFLWLVLFLCDNFTDAKSISS